VSIPRPESLPPIPQYKLQNTNFIITAISNYIYLQHKTQRLMVLLKSGKRHNHPHYAVATENYAQRKWNNLPQIFVQSGTCSRDSSVGVTTRLGTRTDDRGSIPDGRRGGNFSLRHHVQTAFEAHPTSYPGALSLGVKQPGRESDHSRPSSAEVKECVELYIHFPNTSLWRGA
jgi:hypothetical protein